MVSWWKWKTSVRSFLSGSPGASISTQVVLCSSASSCGKSARSTNSGAAVPRWPNTVIMYASSAAHYTTRLYDVPVLRAEQVTKRFGGLTAVNQVSFEVANGELVGIIGPNGAGKSTLFNVIAGVYRPDGGHVLLDGEVIDALKPHERVRLGLARTFQGALAFPNLTVLENVMVGRQTRAMASVLELMF